MSDNIYYVYELQYPNGIPFYVGKGKGDRCYQHLNGGDNKNPYKHNVIKQIRKNNGEPVIKIITNNLIENVAFEIEIFLIAYYGRRDIETGILTNLDNGGTGCSGIIPWNKGKTGIYSKETLRKISKAGKGRIPWNKGKNNYLTDETITKMTNHAIGNSYVTGRKHTEEECVKMSVPVLQYDKNGNFIKEYKSVNFAQKQTGINRPNICAVCKNKRKFAGGFIWKYKNNIGKSKYVQ